MTVLIRPDVCDCIGMVWAANGIVVNINIHSAVLALQSESIYLVDSLKKSLVSYFRHYVGNIPFKSSHVISKINIIAF